MTSPASPTSPLTHPPFSTPTDFPILISRGTPADYLALARFHYRAAPPATIVHILRATDDTTTLLAGVLLISMPPLNAAWRRHAWQDWDEGTRHQARGTRQDPSGATAPGLGAVRSTPKRPGPHPLAKSPPNPDAGCLPPDVSPPSPHRRAALHLNASLRTISRVIVDPRCRGLGVARRLVQHYLAHPLTPRTEALASMGRWCPFFAAAGMREVPSPTPKRDDRLHRAMTAAGVEPWHLIDVERAAAAVRRSAALRIALVQWADASRATRAKAHAVRETIGETREHGLTGLAVLAAATLSARPVAYVSP